MRLPVPSRFRRAGYLRTPYGCRFRPVFGLGRSHVQNSTQFIQVHSSPTTACLSVRSYTALYSAIFSCITAAVGAKVDTRPYHNFALPIRLDLWGGSILPCVYTTPSNAAWGSVYERQSAPSPCNRIGDLPLIWRMVNTFAQADQVLLALYAAPVDASALFRDELGRQWMRSCIARAIRKLQAAEYHCENLRAKIQSYRELAEQSTQVNGIAAFYEQEEIAYELDAFLAAARGCIDFISAMLSLHLRGMSRRASITTLLKRAENEPTAAFSSLLTRWKQWIELLKEYRDECVHYRAIEATGDYKVTVVDGERILTIIPILVPERVQPDKPSGGMPGAGRFLAEVHQSVGIRGVPPCGAEGPLTKDAQKLMAMMEPIEEGHGYIRVERFCQQHLETLHQFASDSFEEVLAFKFQSYAG
jgi:hypothetical protein